MEATTMDPAFRATQADYDEGFKDGEREGYDAGEREGYGVGYDAGYEAGKADAERDALTYSDFWFDAVDEALDLLIRHFDAADPVVSDALRAVARDFNHPSRIWDAPKEVRK